MAKIIKTIIEKAEFVNEYGVKTTNTLVRFDRVYGGNTYVDDFYWYQQIGDGFLMQVCHYKTEKRMRKAMEEFDFFFAKRKPK